MPLLSLLLKYIKEYSFFAEHEFKSLFGKHTECNAGSKTIILYFHSQYSALIQPKKFIPSQEGRVIFPSKKERLAALGVISLERASAYRSALGLLQFFFPSKWSFWLPFFAFAIWFICFLEPSMITCFLWIRLLSDNTVSYTHLTLPTTPYV